MEKPVIHKKIDMLKRKWDKKFKKIAEYGEGLTGSATGIWIDVYLPKDDEREFEPFHFMIPEELYAHLPRRGPWRKNNFKSRTEYSSEEVTEMIRLFENEMKNPWQAMYGIFDERFILEWLNDFYMFLTICRDLNTAVILEPF